MNFVNEDELAMALAYLVGALPQPPRWVLLLNTDGDILTHYRFRDDSARISSILTSVKADGHHAADQMSGGPLHTNISIGSDGTQVTLALGRDHLVCLNLPEVQSLDGLLRATSEGLTPLRDLLGFGHAG